MKAIEGLMVQGVDVGADRLSCVVGVLAGQRLTPFSCTRVVIESLPGRTDPLGGAWMDPTRADPTPPVGTPGPFPLGGNSTPVLAPVAGVWKSERIGERRGQK